LNEPDRYRIAIKFSIARLGGGDDDEDGVQDPKDGQENEADQDQAKDRGAGNTVLGRRGGMRPGN
jgi:hypothetical protein